MTARGQHIPTQIMSSQRDSARQYANPIKIAGNLWRHRELISQFTRREVVQRYKGSYLGLVWSFVTPLALLLVYTFVFSVIFQARWPGMDTNSHGEFALALFAGLLIYNVFSEVTIAAPRLIISNSNYVKKVVFPLEILVISILGSAVVHSLFSVVILLAGSLIVLGGIPWTIILFPLMYLPLLLLCLGLGWFFASLGVFIRDINHLLSVIVQMLFFLTPIFYPLEAIPFPYRYLIYLNPLTFIVNHFRRVALFGQMPDWSEFALMTLLTGLVCLLGYIWFMKSKKTFADVL